MKRSLIIICVLLGSLSSRAQPLADLVEDVQAHTTSMTALRALFSKHPSYIDETDYDYNKEFLGQRLEKADFHYTLADSITRRMAVEVIHKNDQVGYISYPIKKIPLNFKTQTSQQQYHSKYAL